MFNKSELKIILDLVDDSIELLQNTTNITCCKDIDFKNYIVKKEGLNNLNIKILGLLQHKISKNNSDDSIFGI